MEVDGGKWVDVRDVRMVRMGLVEARRLMRRVGKSGAIVMVMRLLGGSFFGGVAATSWWHNFY